MNRNAKISLNKLTVTGHVNKSRNMRHSLETQVRRCGRISPPATALYPAPRGYNSHKISFMRATYAAHLIHFKFNALMPFGEENKLLSS
jgi:hypothetical protein